MWAPRIRTAVAVAVAAGLVVGAMVAGASRVSALARHVHPGSTVTVSSNTCEVGFLLRHGGTVFAAIPASCLGTDGGNGGNGCEESQAPPGSPASIAGAMRRAHVVYSSFTRMQTIGTRSADTCDGNNLALLRLARRDGRRARGEIPGPISLKGLARSAPPSGTTLGVYLGSTSSGRAGSPGTGGWQQEVTVKAMVSASNLGAPTVTPSGRAVGMISQIPLLTGVGASEVGSLARELHFLRKVRAFRRVRLMTR